MASTFLLKFLPLQRAQPKINPVLLPCLVLPLLLLKGDPLLHPAARRRVPQDLPPALVDVGGGLGRRGEGGVVPLSLVGHGDVLESEWRPGWQFNMIF